MLFGAVSGFGDFALFCGLIGFSGSGDFGGNPAVLAEKKRALNGCVLALIGVWVIVDIRRRHATIRFLISPKMQKKALREFIQRHQYCVALIPLQ